MRSSFHNHTHYFQRRNPFQGRRIFTGVEKDQTVNDKCRETLTSHNLDDSHSRCESRNNVIQGGGPGGADSRNKNANNDSLGNPATNPKCQRTNSDNVRRSKCRSTSGSRLRQDVLRATDSTVNNGECEVLHAPSGTLNNATIHKPPEVISGVACVRMCDLCVKETQSYDATRTSGTSDSVTSDPSEAWRSAAQISSTQATDSEADFISCLSLGNSNRAFQIGTAATEAQELIGGRHNITQWTSGSTASYQNRIGDATISSNSHIFERNAEALSEGRMPTFTENTLSSKTYPNQLEAAMLWRDGIGPRDTLRTFSERNGHSPDQNGTQDTRPQEDAKDENTQRCALKDRNRIAWTQPRESHRSSCVEAQTLGDSQRTSVENIRHYSEHRGVDNGGGFSNICSINSSCPDKGGTFPRHSQNITRNSVRLIDHLEQKEGSRLPEKYSTAQSSFRSGEKPMRSESIRSTPNQLHIPTEVTGVSNPTPTLDNRHKNTPQINFTHLSQYRMDKNFTSSNIRHQDLRPFETNFSQRKIVPRLDNYVTEREPLMTPENDMKANTPLSTRSLRFGYRSNIAERRENAAAKLFLMDQKRMLSPLVTSTNIKKESTCPYVPAHVRQKACHLKRHHTNYEQLESTRKLAEQSKLKGDQRAMPFRCNSSDLGLSMKKDNTRDAFSSPTGKISGLVWNPRPVYGCNEERGHHHSCCCDHWHNPKFQSNKSTQTESQDHTTTALKHVKSEMDKHNVSWMRRLLRRGSNSTQPSKQDYFFKPTYHKEPTPASINCENDTDPLVHGASPSQLSGDQVISESMEGNIPVALFHSTLRKTLTSDGAKSMIRDRKTASSTMISARPSSSRVHQSLRSCRSMTHVPDVIQPRSLPEDYLTGLQTVGNHDDSGSLEGDPSEEPWRAARESTDASRTVSFSESRLEKTDDSEPSSPGELREDRNCSNTCQDPSIANTFIGEYLFNLWENQYLCDVAVTVNGKQMMAHKLVLAAFSDAFCPSSPFTRPAICFDIPDSTPEAVYQIFRYMYTSSMDINDDNLEAALNAALFMGVSEVVDIIKDIIKQPEAHNFQKYAKLCETLKLPFDVSSTKMARENLTDLVKSDHFPSMSFDQLLKILDEPDVLVNSEEDTLLAVVKWIEGNPSELPRAHLLLEKLVLESIEAKKLCTYMDEHPTVFSQCGVLSILTKVFRHHAMQKESNDKPSSGRLSFRQAPPQRDYGSRRGSCGERLLSPSLRTRTESRLTASQRCCNNSKLNGDESDNVESGSPLTRDRREKRCPDTAVSTRSEEPPGADNHHRDDGGKNRFRTTGETAVSSSSSVGCSGHELAAGRGSRGDHHDVGGKAAAAALDSGRHGADYCGWRRRLKGSSDYVVGRNFASAKAFKDATFRNYASRPSQRLESDDRGHWSTKATSDSAAFFPRHKERASSDEQIKRTPPVCRRCQNLKFMSARNTPNESARGLKSSSSGNHASVDEVSVCRSQHDDELSSGKRTGDEFWCRTSHVDHDSAAATGGAMASAQYPSRRKLDQSLHNNTTNNADAKWSPLESTAPEGHPLHNNIRPPEKCLKGATQRSLTPSQLMNKRKQTSWKKRYLRLQNKTLSRLCDNARSPDMRMFERRRPKKKCSQSRNPRRRTGSRPFVSFDPEICRRKDRRSDNSTEESVWSPHLFGYSRLEELKYCHQKPLKQAQSATLAIDGSTAGNVWRDYEDDVFGSQRGELFPSTGTLVEPNESLSFLGHDERTSAFKKFSRRQLQNRKEETTVVH